MDTILRLKKVRCFTRSALLPVLWFFAAQIGAQAQDCSMSVGDDFGAVVDANGNLFVWGAIATEVTAGGIQQILPPEQWREVSVSRTPAASAHVLAIRTDGTLWAWGSNTRGQLGDGTTTNRADPVQISTATDWAEIAAGEFHSMARKSDGIDEISGSVYLWGGNSYGQLGFGPIFNDPDLDIRKSIQAPFDTNPYIAIAAGKAHSHGIRSDGTLWTWGIGNSATNGGSELGILVNGGPPIGVVAPTQVGTAAGWSDLFGGYNATFALRNTATQAGQLWVWGSGLNLGTGNGLERTPARVGSGVGWVDISVASTSSSAHTLGLKGDKLYGWGLNYEGGQLGLPVYDGQGSFLIANIKKDLPTALEVSDRFLAIGAGEEFSAVVRKDGFLQTAGINDVGQLANGKTDPSLPGQDFFANANLRIAAAFRATDISLQTALDDGTSPSTLGTFENVPDSAAFWFGRDDTGDTPVDDDQMFEQGEGAQSPALNPGDEASFQLLVPVNSVVKFDWAIFSGSDLNVLSVLVDGVVIDSISGNEPFAEVNPGILVLGNKIIEWRYSQGAARLGDFAVVDNVRVEANTQPDLIVSAINYTPGEYVLDVAGIAGAPNQLLGTEYLDITVEATNQGVDVIATAFTSTDLEIRLSIDRIYGNGDDIVLGTVSQVEGNFDSGNLMRFIGPVQLGDSIPEGCYYLIAKIDTNDALAEFSEANNILVTENRDVCIARLPALRIYNPNADVLNESIDGVNNYLDPREPGVVNFDLDGGFQYYSEAPMRLRFGIQNVGLGRVTGRETWTTKVTLLGASREGLTKAQPKGDSRTETEILKDLTASFDVSIELGDFTIQQLMEGRSEANPTGDILDLDLELALPSGARLNDITGEDKSLDDYLWIISIDLDSTNAVRQSQIIRESPSFVAPTGNPWWIINLKEAKTTDMSATNTTDDDGLFGIKFQPLTVSEADWEALYPGFPADAAGTDEEIANFLAYAFNRNPADLDTEAGQLPITFGLTEFEGLDYQYVAFDIVTRSTDLIYTVQADNNEAFNSPETMVTIKGPFDQLTGMDSLTGEGGLIDKVNVTSVLDQGYTARVTVKDTVDAEPDTMRYLRIVVSVDPDPQGTPVDSFPAVAISESPEGSIVYEPIEWDGPAPVDPVDTLPAALSEAVSLGSSWYYLDWFSYFAYDSASAASWAYSLDLGWIYIASSGSTEQFWFWSDSLSTWLWASKTFPSYFYHWNYSSWAYVQSKSGGGAWLNRISTEIWEEVTP
jgi:alpha-tubulin suppressor-like RCC1 family protein